MNEWERITWARLMMNWRKVGWRPAPLLSLLAIGFDIVLMANVPSFNTGIFIIYLSLFQLNQFAFLLQIPTA